jgi:hypothetical protein
VLIIGSDVETYCLNCTSLRMIDEPNSANGEAHNGADGSVSVTFCCGKDIGDCSLVDC